MSVGVIGQHRVANEILNKAKRTPRRRVIRINQRPKTKGCLYGGAITNNRVTDFLNEVRHRSVQAPAREQLAIIVPNMSNIVPFCC